MPPIPTSLIFALTHCSGRRETSSFPPLFRANMQSSAAKYEGFRMELARMDTMLSRVGWSKVYFAQYLDVSERTVRDWCAKGSGSPGYKAAMKCLGIVARVVGV